MIKEKMFAITAAVLALPITVSAQYSGPQDSYGLAGDDDISDTITSILNYVLGFLAGLSILMIVVAGIMYITSGGDEGRVDKAKSWLLYAIIGLVVALLGFVIVSTVSNMLGAG